MASHVTVKESTMVCPSSKTPNQTITLPSLDTILRLPYSHTPLLYIYTSKSHNHINHPSKYFTTNNLKSCLSNVLVPFYPLAGRLRSNPKSNHLEIICNAKGVLFVEAETSQALEDFGEFTPSQALREMAFPSAWDYSKGLSSFPILMVQLTRFRCGGVMLGFMAHHSVQDGFAMAHFVNSWSRLVRGLDVDVWPYHDRLRCVGPRYPPQVKFRHLEYEPPSSNVTISGNSKPSMSTTTTCNLFKFSKAQISALKQHTMFQHVKHKPSTYTIMAAHLWRCVCKARGLPYDQEVRLYIPVNGRPRLKDPSLPQGYFGNILFRGVCIAKAGDVACKPLWCTVIKVQEALVRMDNEYLRSAIDYLALNPGLTSLNPSLTWIEQESCPNLSINSWIGLPFGEADFGSGGPSYVRLGGVGYEGQTLIMSSTNGDGSLSVSINLSIVHMNLLKNYIYDFVEIRASL